MCCHNEDDYDCLDCCYEYGKEDASENLPNSPPYKNFDQCDAYYEGYLIVWKENIKK
jgi:hypothetical protein